MPKKTIIYNSIDEVPINHLKKINIHRSETFMNSYDTISVKEFVNKLSHYPEDSILELDKDYGYYNDCSAMLKINYNSIESDEEFNKRVKQYKKEQYAKYSAEQHQKNIENMRKATIEEKALYEKLKKKYENLS